MDALIRTAERVADTTTRRVVTAARSIEWCPPRRVRAFGLLSSHEKGPTGSAGCQDLLD
jgi:hypothetical protein